jgi:hypothetical protein
VAPAMDARAMKAAAAMVARIRPTAIGPRKC